MSKCKVIALANQKGGTGKTTTTVREKPEGGYEMIAGHRRKMANELAEKKAILSNFSFAIHSILWKVECISHN